MPSTYKPGNKKYDSFLSLSGEASYLEVEAEEDPQRGPDF